MCGHSNTLLRLSHSDYKIKRTFGGVFASDMLPEKRGHYRSFIVNTDSSMSTVLEGASKKRKIDISEKEKKSLNEDERNSLFGKNRKPWSLPTSSPGAIESSGALKQHEKYDVVISNDLRLAEEVPPLSVYIGAGFAAEIKTFHVVLLAEVFENFRTLSMNYFELDPVHFYTTPSLTWSDGIKTMNITLELLTDINMYLMLETGIRGGMCLVSKRYSKANNKYLDNFEEISPSKFIISLDVNNL
ncbi:uncharacterized protein TNIN_204411 [Trichonephila inaurata madagascariensis]|uniref:Uncharacterized protein n=1 Tax=Trichonephila inaurata madagascariensis TaxID=2747483 RepID=A0A8X7BXM3_9ARAC|nr:uncharacterized protein TNIN_204411 [Trichonephila inaurata madagascariensis]